MTNALLAVLVVLVSAFALRETSTVTLPIALAIFLIALHWPLQHRLDRIMPRGVAMIISTFVFLGVCTGFVWAVLESADEVRDHAGQYESQLDSMVSSAQGWLAARGIDVSGAGGMGDALKSAAKSFSKATFDFLAGFLLVVAFLSLGLLEVRAFKDKLQTSVASRRGEDHWAGVLRRIGTQFQRYVVVRTGIGAMTGVGCGAGALIIGLDFWYIWGLLNFLLNYIPTLGSILGVIPPVLFAWFQFGDPAMVLLTLAVVGGVQLVMGYWIDPLVEGRYLRMSPVVVLSSVVFWGWVWGIPGALIAVPLTIGIVLVCREFESTRWVATMLAEVPDEGEQPDETEGAERASPTEHEAR